MSIIIGIIVITLLLVLSTVIAIPAMILGSWTGPLLLILGLVWGAVAIMKALEKRKN